MRHFTVLRPAVTALLGILGVLTAVLLAGCGNAPQQAPARSQAAPAPLPGEEPLETESIGDQEVTGLPPEAPPATPPSQRPCAWASAWRSDAAPKPMVPGVGAIENPVRVADAPVRLPQRTPPPRGQIVVELVISPDGVVREAQVVRSTEPPWPAADRAVEDAVKQWRYEPPKLDGTPIALCSTAFVQP